MYKAELLKKLIAKFGKLIYLTTMPLNQIEESSSYHFDQFISTVDITNGTNIPKENTRQHIAQIISLLYHEPEGPGINTPNRMLEPCCFYFQMACPILFRPQTTDQGPEGEKF